MEKLCAVILAAGEGTRMRSARPKVMMQVLGKPMAGWVADNIRGAGIDDICMVVGFGREMVQNAFRDRATFAFQDKRLGTGHALSCAGDFLAAHAGGHVLVINGDSPLVSSATLAGMVAAHTGGGYAATIMTAVMQNPTGYGRIIRDGHGDLKDVVEQWDTDETTRAIREVNAGAYVYDIDALLGVLPQLKSNNSKGEFYITDIAALLKNSGLRIAVHEAPEREVLGANDRAELTRVNEEARIRILAQHLASGVGINCMDGVVIGPDVAIGPDTELLPGVIMRGRCTIGAGCVIGPNALLEDVTLGDGVTFNASQAYGSTIGSGTRVGPFAHLRPGCVIADNVKIGNFNELKNAHLGESTSMAHLSYAGDARIGAGVNLGCGVVTVNYDGKSKHVTTVEDGAFVGCNANMVAPVTIGRGAYVAAGSTITGDVPSGALGIARERQSNHEGWVEKRDKKHAEV